MTYSRDFREKVLLVKEKECLSFAKIAKRFNIGIASVVPQRRLKVSRFRQLKLSHPFDTQLMASPCSFFSGTITGSFYNGAISRGSVACVSGGYDFEKNGLIPNIVMPLG